MRTVPRYAASLTVVVGLIVAGVFWLNSGGFGAPLAFSDVQEAVRKIDTAVVVAEHPNHPHKNFKMFISRATSRGRLEWSNGVVFVMDMEEGKVLILNPKSKTAQITPGPTDDVTPNEILDEFASLEQDAVDHLGERVFNGQTLVGFELEYEGRLEGDMQKCVWVDPATRLPVRMEAIPVDPNDPRTAELRSVCTFTFNQPLDQSLFRLTPPEGYKLLDAPYIKLGTLELPAPPPPDDEALASPTIYPKTGIGKARFGMTAEQVIEALGKPDEMREYWKHTPEEDQLLEKAHKEAEEKNLDPFERERYIQEARKGMDPTTRTPDGVHLRYTSRGFAANVEREEGFTGIQCHVGHPGMRDFTGKTDKGIGMAATREEVVKAGSQAGVPKQRILDYKSPKMGFHFFDGRMAMMFVRQ
jgi:outer membrane lipoprotein-sorting protein